MKVAIDFTREGPFSDTVVAVKKAADGRWYMQVHPAGDTGVAQEPVYLPDATRRATLSAAQTMAGWLGATVEVHQ